MKILSIGNSFSMDAHRYLHRIAKADGFDLTCCNLYIGGCSLSTHFWNMMKNSRSYNLGINGESSGFFVSIEEALLTRDWDVVTLQQVSTLSDDYESYQPYLNELATFVRKMVPKAKIAIHQTWAYEKDSPRFAVKLNCTNSVDMYNNLKKSYKKAAEDIKADFTIPSGELFQNLIESGMEKLHRDTYHASLGGGRYALGLLWYKVLSGNTVADNSFSDFDEEISPYEINLIKTCVEKM